MTNKEIKKICEEMQAKHCKVDWKFRITQNKEVVKINWEYIDDELNTPWIIKQTENMNIVFNEHNEFMNEELEDTSSLIQTIKSIVYYMVSRY